MLKYKTGGNGTEIRRHDNQPLFGGYPGCCSRFFFLGFDKIGRSPAPCYRFLQAVLRTPAPGAAGFERSRSRRIYKDSPQGPGSGGRCRRLFVASLCCVDKFPQLHLCGQFHRTGYLAADLCGRRRVFLFARKSQPAGPCGCRPEPGRKCFNWDSRF